MLFKEVFDIHVTEIVECGEEAIVIPVPPGNRLHALGDHLRKPLPDKLRGHSTDDCVRSHITRDDGAGADHRAITTTVTPEDGCAMADPDVVTDHDAVVAAPGKEVVVGFRAIEIVGGAVCEVVQGGGARWGDWWR